MPRKKKVVRPNPAAAPAAEAAGPVPVQLTPEQQAQIMREQQRIRTETAVLKQLFAENAAKLAIAEAENQRLIQELQRAQQVIEDLSQKLTEATAPADENGEPEEAEEATPEAPQSD